MKDLKTLAAGLIFWFLLCVTAECQTQYQYTMYGKVDTLEGVCWVSLWEDNTSIIFNNDRYDIVYDATLDEMVCVNEKYWLSFVKDYDEFPVIIIGKLGERYPQVVYNLPYVQGRVLNNLIRLCLEYPVRE